MPNAIMAKVNEILCIAILLRDMNFVFNFSLL